jgi:hypothetical protein
MYIMELCGVFPDRLQQGEEIQPTELSVKQKSDLRLAFDSTSVPGTVLDCDVMNIQ